MSAIIGITILFINSIIYLFSRERGLQLYIILSMIAPVTYIFGVRISYEIMFFFPMIVLFMIAGDKTCIKRQGRYLMAYFMLFIVATLISNLVNEPTNELMSIFGIGRMVMLYIIFTNKSNIKQSYIKMLRVCLYANVVCMMLQLILPNAVAIFNGLYVKESSTAIEYFYTIGRFTRLTGTFSNTAPAGFFFLVVLATYLVEYSKENSNKNMIVLIITLLCGIATVSKTFFVGFPILLVANIFLGLAFKSRECLGKRKKVDIKKPILIIVAVVSVFLFLKYTESILSTSYYIDNVLSTNILSSRYNNGSGNLVSTISVFKDNWLLGVGATTLIGEFVGDSLYVTVLHNTGILGFFLVMTLIVIVIKENIKNANRLNLLLILCIIMCGFAVPTIFNFFGILTLAYITVNTNILDVY